MKAVELDVLAWRMFEESNDALFLVDTHNETVWQANPSAQRLTGLRFRELRGKPLEDLIGSERRGRMNDLRSAVRNTGVFHSQEEYLLRREERDAVPINLTVSRIHTPTGPLGLVVARDISDRKHAEKQLRRFNEELEHQVTEKTLELYQLNATLEQRIEERTAQLAEKNVELDAFAQTVSHDLRAPLRAIEAMATTLIEDHTESLNPNGRGCLDRLLQSTQLMDRLIEDLLAYSRLGADRLSTQPVSVIKSIDSVKRQLSASIDLRNAKFIVTDEPQLLQAHPSTLVQIIANLVSNAIKFVDQERQPEIHVQFERRDEEMIRCWIIDNGIGVAAADQDRIFAPFTRLHGCERFPGTGIGLAIVARACKRMGGACGVESELGKGSRFWFELPSCEIEG